MLSTISANTTILIAKIVSPPPKLSFSLALAAFRSRRDTWSSPPILASVAETSAAAVSASIAASDGVDTVISIPSASGSEAGTAAEVVDPDSNAMLNATLKIILFRMLVWFFFYNGMLPCFLAGLLSFFVANMFNALITRKRVLRGSITSSI